MDKKPSYEELISKLTQLQYAVDEHAIVTRTDIKGTITHVNSKFCQLSGYSQQELIGQNHRILNSGNQDKIYWSNMYKKIANGNVWHDEVRNKAKDGHYYWVDTTIVPIADVNGKPQSYMSIRTDITEPKNMELDAIQANKAKSDFLANMSHELRTPMHGILSYASLGIARIEKSTPEKILKYFTNIKISGDRLLSLLNNLLDLAKLESGKMEINKTENSLIQIVKGCVLEQQARLTEYGLKISYSQENNEGRGYFDAVKIGQVITNFLSNAIKFSPKGGQINIRISSIKMEKTDKSALLFSVKDEGNGIPDGEHKLVFDKFSQSSAQAVAIKGTGLGLPICKEIIDIHQGDVWCENHPDGGAVFSFIIPIEQLKIEDKKRRKDDFH